MKKKKNDCTNKCYAYFIDGNKIKYKIAQTKNTEYDNSVLLWKGIFLVLCSNKTFLFLYISLFLNNKRKKQCLPNWVPKCELA